MSDEFAEYEFRSPRAAKFDTLEGWVELHQRVRCDDPDLDVFDHFIIQTAFGENRKLSILYERWRKSVDDRLPSIEAISDGRNVPILPDPDSDGLLVPPDHRADPEDSLGSD